MIKVCVCDDDELIANKISSIIDSLAEEKNIKIKKDVYYSGSAMVRGIENSNSYYDLIFLDIEMEDIDGIEAAKRLRLRDELANIIYVTSYQNYAIETFAVRPYQFVLKPFEDEVIEKHFMDVYERVLSDSEECFKFKFCNVHYKVLLKDIMYFESCKRSIIIHLSDGTKYKFYGKINNVENMLIDSKSDFLRIHQSILVNLKFIRIKRFSDIQLMNGTILQISENKRNIVNQQYVKHVEESMKDERNS
ncbi:MAG: response regulator transcription factor [Lachnospiraceae bacterium]|nr:response regulator transcription factor [Lachnospiraceae bacterium]